MHQGIFEALDAVTEATGSKKINTIGYCIGGTMLGASLAYMAAKGDQRVNSATFFASQLDFAEAGDLKVFIDDEQLKNMETRMAAAGGYLEGASMATTFNMLRANDLIWSFVVNNYLLGKEPFRFDLLYWNADATRMPQTLHMFYLRQFYHENNLAKAQLKLGGVTLDPEKVEIPVYMLSSREDHIAPVNSVFRGMKLLGGPVRFIVAGSGHIAGVINPPAKEKYQYWCNETETDTESLDDWWDGAEEHPGSWWPDWDAWLSKQSGKKVAARVPGDRNLEVIEDAPGSYVMARS
jgi:polyhydroxyalkanoate synthase